MIRVTSERKRARGLESRRTRVAQGSATSAWSFIQSAPKPNLRVVSAKQVWKSLNCIGKAEGAILGYEGAVGWSRRPWVLSRWENEGRRTMTAPPCTTRRTWRWKEEYSLSDISESAWVSNLRIRGTSLTSFRAGTVGGGAIGKRGS